MKEQLKNNFTFCSYFIMLYEQFWFSLKQYSKIPYSDGNYIYEENYFKQKNHLIKVDNSKMNVYQEEVIKRDQNGKTNSVFLWAVDFGLLDKEDYENLVEIVKLRNTFVHEMPNIILRTEITKEEIKLLKKLIMVSKKVNNRAQRLFDDVNIDDSECSNIGDRCFQEMYDLFIKQIIED